MSILLTGVPTNFGRGKYYYQASSAAIGTAKLQISLDGKAAQDIPSTVTSASAVSIIEIPAGQVTAILTGDALVSLSFISRG